MVMTTEAKWQLLERAPRGPTSLDAVRPWALEEARRSGEARVIIHNTLTGTYMHETPEDWESSKERRPVCVFVERVEP